MLMTGYGAPLVTATAGPDLRVRPSGRTLADDLARAAARRRSPIPPLPPKLAREPKPRPQRKPRRVEVDRRYGPRLQPRQDWIDLYQQGCTIAHIAAQFGTSWHTVRRHLTHAGIPLRDDYARSRARTFTPDELAAAATAYLGGSTLRVVADLLHTRQDTASNALQSIGVWIRPPGRGASRIAQCAARVMEPTPSGDTRKEANGT